MEMDKVKQAFDTKAGDATAEKNVHKTRYVGALKENKKKLSGIELGISLGFSKEYTKSIIEELLLENKIVLEPASDDNFIPNNG